MLDQPAQQLLSFVLRAAEYYLCPPGEAVRAALPPGMSAAERRGRLKKPRAELVLVPCARRAETLPGDPKEGLKRAPARAPATQTGRATADGVRSVEEKILQVLLSAAQDPPQHVTPTLIAWDDAIREQKRHRAA